MRLLLSLSLFVSFTSNAIAGPPLVHAPEYQVGQKIKTESTTETEQTLVISGMSLETQANTYATSLDEVQSVSTEEVVTKGGVTALRIELGLPGGQSMQFDSGNPDAEVPAGPLSEMNKFFKALAASKYNTTLDVKRKVKQVQYEENALGDVPDALKEEASPEKIKKEANQQLNRLPGKALEQGESWTINEEQNLGSGQVFQVTRKFTYKGPEEHNGKTLEHIVYETETVAFEIGADSQLPIQSKSSDLSVVSSDGHLWYDASQKRVVETAEKFHVSGDLILVANGVELPTELDLTMNIKSVITVD